MKYTEDDLGRVYERSLLTSSDETGGSEETVTPLKIGFKRGGGRVIDVSLPEIDCFKFAKIFLVISSWKRYYRVCRFLLW